MWRIVNNTAAPLGFAVWGWQEPVEVRPTQTARVRIGGKGRPVIVGSWSTARLSRRYIGRRMSRFGSIFSARS